MPQIHHGYPKPYQMQFLQQTPAKLPMTPPKQWPQMQHFQSFAPAPQYAPAPQPNMYQGWGGPSPFHGFGQQFQAPPLQHFNQKPMQQPPGMPPPPQAMPPQYPGMSPAHGFGQQFQAPPLQYYNQKPVQQPGVAPQASVQTNASIQTNTASQVSKPKPTALSGHGDWKKEYGKTTVPPGCTITFYAMHGSPISDKLGGIIETHGDTSKVYKRTYKAGEVIHNYMLHPPHGLNIKGNPITVAKETALADLMRPGGGDYHWAACCADPLDPNSSLSFDVSGIRNDKTGSIHYYSK